MTDKAAILRDVRLLLYYDSNVEPHSQLAYT